MSREVQDTNSKRVQTLGDLTEVFTQGSRPIEKFLIGMEFERFLVDRQTSRALEFNGDRGIERFLQDLSSPDASGFPWEKVYDQGRLISLKWSDTAITLEPGGQVEISCKAYKELSKLFSDLQFLNQKMNDVAAKLGGMFLAFGVHPFETVNSAPWMPKTRYRFMRKYYEARQNSAFEMMLLTASIQVNYDYTSEEDARKKVLVSSFLSPVFSAIFANSAIENGKPNGFLSRRIPIWEKTDPDRRGIPKFFVDGTFSFEKYRDYAANIPMYFAYRNGTYVDVQAKTFQQFLKNPEQFGPVTMTDWDLHLTTLFPEVRLKNHLEFRSVDSNNIEYVMALAAFWKGLFFDPSTIDRWFEILKNLTQAELMQSRADVARMGLKANLGRYSILDLGKDLFKDAQRFLEANMIEENEAIYLEPIEKILRTEKSPARLQIESFQVA